MKTLPQRLELRPGVTAIIGSGGKTTLLRTLGEELAARGRSVLLCTTTKIYPFPGLPCAHTLAELDALRMAGRLVCAGTLRKDGKLTALDAPMAALAERFDYVLAEADGAAGRPLKAHDPHEPVIPPETGQTILVAGASGFWQPIAQSAHRPEKYARLAGVSAEDDATPETEAAVLRAEGLHDRIYVNQVETLPALLDAKELAARLNCPVLAGSLQRKEFFQCSS